MGANFSFLSTRLPKTVYASKLGHKRRPGLIIPMVICGGFLFLSSARAQTIKGTYSFDRSPAHIDHLLELLRSGDTTSEVFKYFFGVNKIFDRQIVNLLVFIDKPQRKKGPSETYPQIGDIASYIALTKDGKKLNRLYGEKYVHVLVFVAEDTCEPNSVSTSIEEKDPAKTIKITKELSKETQELSTQVKKRDPLFVHQSSIDYRGGSGEFIVSAMARTLAAVLGGKDIEKGEEAKKGEDIPDKPIKLYEIGKSGVTKVFFGYVKIPVYENTINRITVEENYGDNKVFRHIATFGNYSSSVITTSIGIMGSFLEKVEEDEDKRTPVNAYLLGHIYIKRPRLPSAHYQKKFNRLLEKSSFSIVAGTRISTSLFDDLFIGVCAGHLLSTIGIVVGASFRTPKTVPAPATPSTPTGDKRTAGLCAGLTFIF
jgi:hypothetical protein